MREYKDCYIAVLDLLGFKNSLENFTCEEIATIFDEINSRYVISFDKTAKPIVKDEDIHFKVMSDTVCIFIEENVRNALTGLIAICDYLQIRLLRQCVPILSRGAIVKGKIFNDGDIPRGMRWETEFIIERALEAQAHEMIKTEYKRFQKAIEKED